MYFSLSLFTPSAFFTVFFGENNSSTTTLHCRGERRNPTVYLSSLQKIIKLVYAFLKRYFWCLITRLLKKEKVYFGEGSWIMVGPLSQILSLGKPKQKVFHSKPKICYWTNLSKWTLQNLLWIKIRVYCLWIWLVCVSVTGMQIEQQRLQDKPKKSLIKIWFLNYPIC